MSCVKSWTEQETTKNVLKLMATSTIAIFGNRFFIVKYKIMWLLKKMIYFIVTNKPNEDLELETAFDSILHSNCAQ